MGEACWGAAGDGGGDGVLVAALAAGEGDGMPASGPAEVVGVRLH